MDSEIVVSTEMVDRSVKALERGETALEMRRQGLSYPAIADKLGVTVEVARRLINKALKNLAAPDANELRLIEAARLDVATEAIWPEVIQGNLRAVDRLIRLSARRSALFGLDMPTVTHNDDEYKGPAILEVVPFSGSGNGKQAKEGATETKT